MTDYAFDPEFAELVALLPGELADLSDPASIRDFRDGGLASLIGETPDRDDVIVEDRSVPGPEGGPDVAVRIYRPKAPAGPRGAMVYIHGGGFMFGSIEMMDGACQGYAAETDAVIVSVEYRLAPDDPYPAGLEDCYAALVWLADHADELGVDPARLAVGGGSAGGGLAAATALLARDRGGPPLCFQFLQIPELDDRLETASMRAYTDTPLWNRPSAEWSWKHYLGDLHGSSDVPYTAAPSRCEDLSGLPPAYVSTMEFDPLRDEGILYALGLLGAGVQVELHSYPGTFHGSAMFADAEVSRRDSGDSIRAIKRALAARSAE